MPQKRAKQLPRLGSYKYGLRSNVLVSTRFFPPDSLFARYQTVVKSLNSFRAVNHIYFERPVRRHDNNTVICRNKEYYNRNGCGSHRVCFGGRRCRGRITSFVRAYTNDKYGGCRAKTAREKTIARATCRRHVIIVIIHKRVKPSSSSSSHGARRSDIKDARALSSSSSSSTLLTRAGPVHAQRVHCTSQRPHCARKRTREANKQRPTYIRTDGLLMIKRHSTVRSTVRFGLDTDAVRAVQT